MLRKPFKYVLRNAVWLLRNCDSILSFILFPRELNKKRNEIFERGMAHMQHLLRENSDARKFALRDNNSLELSDLIKSSLYESTNLLKEPTEVPIPSSKKSSFNAFVIEQIS